jgi:hypothetical protein
MAHRVSGPGPKLEAMQPLCNTDPAQVSGTGTKTDKIRSELPRRTDLTCGFSAG